VRSPTRRDITSPKNDHICAKMPLALSGFLDADTYMTPI